MEGWREGEKEGGREGEQWRWERGWRERRWEGVCVFGRKSTCACARERNRVRESETREREREREKRACVREREATPFTKNEIIGLFCKRAL